MGQHILKIMQGTPLRKTEKDILIALVLIVAILLSPACSLIKSVQAFPGLDPEWKKNYGSFLTDEKAYSLIQTSDGYMLAGTIYSYPYQPTGYHSLLVKTDSSGNFQWNGTYPGGGNDEDYVRSVVQTGDGGYVFAGYTRGPPYPSLYFYAWLVKTDSVGNPLWNKIYTSLGQSYIYSMVKTSDGGFALAGKRLPTTNSTSYEAMLVKTDSSGTIVWSKTYGASGDYANSVVQTGDGFALAGSAFWKTDSVGNLQWSKATAPADSIIQTSDGGYGLLGISAPLPGYDSFTLYKKYSNGNPQWETNYPYSTEDEAKSLVQTSDGGYALAGITKDLGAGLSDGYLVKTDSNGVEEWWDYFGGAYEDGINCVIKTSDGGLALAGYSKSYTNGGFDMWLIKMPTINPSTYSATIWAWDALDSNGWIAEPITMDGAPTGYSTPHTFTGLTGTHTFTVPSTDVNGRAFSSWDTGEMSTTITVNSGGTHTAQYASYVANIWAWDVEGWIAEPISMDGVPTGFNTPHSFTGLTGTHTFTVPSTDVLGYPFSSWDTGETSTTITVTEGGTHTAQYKPPSFSVKTWYWTDDTVIKSVANGDVDGDTQEEIVTGGYYWDGARYTAQLCVWNGVNMALENVKTWYWTSTTLINSVAVGDVDNDGQTEIVTGGYYNNGNYSSAQLCVWNGATLELENIKTWHWQGDTEIVSVAVADVDADGKPEIVTGGSFYSGLYNAQLCVWDGATLTLENVRSWLWTGFTYINSIMIEDVDGDGNTEIVTGGTYWDGSRFNAQLCVWDGTTLALENVKTWYWTGSTIIYSVAVEDVDGDGNTEIVTGGNYNDGTRTVAQLCVWDGTTLALQSWQSRH